MTAKEYVEKNIELIDSELEQFFINMYTDSLPLNQCNEVLNILTKAKIFTLDARWDAFDYITDRILDTWVSREGVSLLQWVKVLFVWRFGFKESEIVDHLIENKDDINADIYFKSDKEGWVIKSL